MISRPPHHRTGRKLGRKRGSERKEGKCGRKLKIMEDEGKNDGTRKEKRGGRKRGRRIKRGDGMRRRERKGRREDRGEEGNRTRKDGKKWWEEEGEWK
ncbi:hypothetical protein Pcinc_043850 [Petrolisthes cinctipes]|uniref:Uncharacterized protein n=1 Tax=Petrolisthes cinctipes TaxID=88211 RepID=A0AAE1BER5_PETCI|nr:hypothetical protein Pcinc_043850 [Petrolisthes cinctipes]